MKQYMSNSLFQVQLDICDQRSQQIYSLRAPGFTPVFFVMSVLIIFLVFCVVPNDDSFSGLSILDSPSVVSNVYLNYSVKVHHLYSGT